MTQRDSDFDLDPVLEQNRALVMRGEHRKALTRLKQLVAEHPDREDIRLALAQQYRELGNPDQAGRWGYTIPHGATEYERDMFFRSVKSRNLDSAQLKRELFLDREDELPTEFVPIVRQVEPTVDPDGNRSAGDVRAESAVGWLIVCSVCSAVVGLVVVFALAVFVPAGVRVVALATCALVASFAALASAVSACAETLFRPGAKIIAHVLATAAFVALAIRSISALQ